LRVVVGGVVMMHGLLKLGWVGKGGSIPGVAGWFNSLGLQPGLFWAVVATTAEALGGLLMVVGLGGPLGAGIVAADLIVVTIVAHVGQGFWAGGGKAANLGELIRAGFRVPDGFVITTDAYTLAVGGGVAPADSRARLLTSAVPPTVASAVRDAYRAMGSPHVAVRSSATAEDLPDASFAGQQDTIPDVAGDDAVL